MSELTPQSRAFLEAHKSTGVPTAADAARVRAALDKRLAAPKPPAARRLTGLKVGVLITLGLIGALLLRAGREVPVVAPPLPSAPVIAVIAPAAVSVPAKPDLGLSAGEPSAAPRVTAATPPPPSPNRKVSSPAPPTPVRPMHVPPMHVPATPVPPTPVPPTPVPPTPVPPTPVPPAPPSDPPMGPLVESPLSPSPAPPLDEFALVGEAEDLLRQRQPKAALEVLARWEAHFGKSGQFEQEAMAGKIVAFCASGDLDMGRREALRFFERFPRSLHRNRIERACSAD